MSRPYPEPGSASDAGCRSISTAMHSRRVAPSIASTNAPIGSTS